MLDFGATFLTDPPYQVFVDRIVKAEQLGFRYGWTYDSHILWQESYPLLALAAVATSSIKVGHCVTNPGIREPTVTASGYATLHDISEGRMVMGIGRGDSSRRVVGLDPVPVALFEAALEVIKGPDERARGHLPRTAHSDWSGRGRSLRSRCTRRVTARARSVSPAAWATARIIQLADPEITRWIIELAVRRGREGRARSGRAGAGRMRTGRRRRRRPALARGDALVPGDGLQPCQGPDRALRNRRPDPQGAARVRSRRRGVRLRRPQSRRRRPRQVHQRRGRRPVPPPRRGGATRRAAAGARGVVSVRSTCT